MYAVTYEQGIIKLRDNHIYPKKVIHKTLKKESVLGLEVDAIPLLRQGKMDICKKVLGESFKVDWLPNQEIIYITKL